VGDLFSSPTGAGNQAANGQNAIQQNYIQQQEAYTNQALQNEQNAIARLGPNPYLSAGSMMNPGNYQVNPGNAATFGGSAPQYGQAPPQYGGGGQIPRGAFQGVAGQAPPPSMNLGMANAGMNQPTPPPQAPPPSMNLGMANGAVNQPPQMPPQGMLQPNPQMQRQMPQGMRPR
jgi:hypothetical protein